jgi:hypothetical protein
MMLLMKKILSEMKIYKCSHPNAITINEKYRRYIKCDDCNWESEGWNLKKESGNN